MDTKLSTVHHLQYTFFNFHWWWWCWPYTTWSAYCPTVTYPEGVLKYHVPNITWKLSGDTKLEVNMNDLELLHYQPGNTSTIDALTETCDVLQDHLAICHRWDMQRVHNISSFKFNISIFMLYDFPFEVNIWGGGAQWGFWHTWYSWATEEEKVLYLVQCRKDEFEKAVTKSPSVCLKVCFLFVVHSMGNNFCHFHYNLSCTGKYCDEYELQYWASYNILPLYCILLRYWHWHYKCHG